ncbi:Hypothetical protein ABZS17I87_00296 [Kosakonia cowanii]
MLRQRTLTGAGAVPLSRSAPPLAGTLLITLKNSAANDDHARSETK